MLKRSVDILLSLIFGLATLPILAVAALLICLDSPGPILYRQRRVGRGFKEFQLYKLRTMVAGEGASITLGHDPRITRVGRLLRRHKIDELPQLWNVLRGEMGLVGPRPVIPELVHEFCEHYETLLAVRPGLTDPATLRYVNETEILAAATDSLSYFKTVVMRHKLRLSILYMKRATPWSDLQCIGLTIVALIVPAARVQFSKPVLASTHTGQREYRSTRRKPVVSVGHSGSFDTRYTSYGTTHESGITGVQWAGRSMRSREESILIAEWHAATTGNLRRTAARR